jgi:circadian clock protein KaiB
MARFANRARYDFSLYICGPTPRSHRALTNTENICEEHLTGKDNFHIIEIFQNPEQTAEHDVIVAPTLIKETPPPCAVL